MTVENLKSELKKGRVVLFAGAGVSATLGVPNWSELMAHIGYELGYDPEVFKLQSDSYLQLAEYYKIKKGSIGPLRSWMDKKFNISESIVAKSSIYQRIADLGFHSIYTTNYDSNIETAFRMSERGYNKIVSVEDFASAESENTDIIKLHGDFSDDNSIVLSETDYFDRLSFTSPLDTKFRADVIGKPLLFIGYSLSDINLRLLLHTLSKTWADSKNDALRPSHYIFLNQTNEVVSSVLEKWGVVTLSQDTGDQSKDLETFLNQLKN